MKHANIIKSIFAAIALLAASGAWADTWTDPNTGYTWMYRIIEDGAEIYGDWFRNTGWMPSVSPRPSGSLSIPAMIGGRAVTGIGSESFIDCADLTNIAIPNSVTNIEGLAFTGCSGLKSVIIPSGVRHIGSAAFENCISLETVSLPRTIDFVQIYECQPLNPGYEGSGNLYGVREAAFKGCTNIRNMSLPFSALKLTMKSLIPESYEVITNISTTGEVLDIPSETFCGCSSLALFQIPNTVTNIGESAFYGCKAIESVEIPHSVMNIGERAFYDCSQLKVAYLPYDYMGLIDKRFQETTEIIRYKKLWRQQVVLNANGGTCSPDVLEVDYGGRYDRLPLPSRLGYVFVSWSWNGFTIDSESSVAALDDHELIAQWLPNKYMVSFDANGGIGNVMFELNCGATIAGPMVYRDGYSFAGWSPEVDATVPASNVTYTAQWRINQYTVVFDANGGIGGVTNEQDYASEIVPPEVTREGCSFEGWLPEVDGTVPASNVTFVAQWKVWSAHIDSTETSVRELYPHDYKNITNIVLSSEIAKISAEFFRGCCSLSHIAIPDGVTDIGEGAFSQCKNLQSVVIPDSVTNIGVNAFSDCCSLESVAIPDKVGCVKAETFYRCTALTNVAIGSGVKSVEWWAFGGCSSLREIVVPKNVECIGGSAFVGCRSLEKMVLPFVGSSRGESWFGDSGEDLLGWLFGYDFDWKNSGVYFGWTSVRQYGVYIDSSIPSSLRTVVITDETEIGPGAFMNCDMLESVTIPDCCRRIEHSAFYGCAGLRQIVVPVGVISIGDLAFHRCDGLEKIVVPGHLGSQGFDWDTCATVEISEGSTDVAFGAFNGFSNISSVVIPEGVTNIGYYAFGYCDGLHDITIPASVRMLESGAFCDCQGLKSISILSKDIFIPGYAGNFAKCTNVTDVIVPGWQCNIPFDAVTNLVVLDGASEIRDNAFRDCKKLERICIPNSITNIGDSAFAGCIRVESITIPQCVCDDSLAKVFPDAYQSIKDVYICEGTEAFAPHVFDGCDSLERISIPPSIVSIGDHAFLGCDNLKRVDISDFDAWLRISFGLYANPLSVSQAALYLNGVPLEIVGRYCVPDGVYSIPSGSFRNQHKLTEVILPEGLARIEAGAFEGCSALASISIPDSVVDWGIDSLSPAMKAHMTYDADGLMIYNGWLLGYADKDVATLTVPEGIVGIGSYALAAMYDLETVTLPQSLKYIAEGAFWGDSYLDNLVIPDGVEVVGDGAFADCSYLQTLTLGKGIKSVGARAFAGCTQLSSVVFANGLVEIGAEAFDGCWRMQSVSLPLSTTNVASSALNGCTSLTGVTTPTHGGKMSEWFSPVYSQILDVTVPDGETEVRAEMFKGCSALRSMALPEGVTNIAASAFENCGALGELTLPESLISIGEATFKNCGNLRAIVLPENVERIGEGVFANCGSLSELTLSRKLAAIPAWAFAGCWSLDSFVVPASVTYLGDRFVSSGTTAIYYLGNAPECQSGAYEVSHNNWMSYDVYGDANGSLTSYVILGTKGWDGRPNSRDIPQSWNGRDITIWQLNVTFDAAGGTVTPSSDVFVVGGTYSTLPVPMWEGHIFVGWKQEGEFVSAGTIVSPDIGDTLVAQWTPNRYTVAFDANGGVGGFEAVVVEYGASHGELPIPTRTGYTFDGWFTLAEGGVQVVAGSRLAYASDVTLYAHWTEIVLHDDDDEAIATWSAAPADAASEYNGYIGANGAIVGTIQVKVGKPGRKDGKASVKATVVVGTKKVTLKAKDKGKVEIAKDGPTEIEFAGSENCVVVIGGEGISGYYGVYDISGSRNFFTSKDKVEALAAENVIVRWVGSLVIMWNGGTASVTIGKKGKAKVSVVLANGTKGTTTSGLLIGDEWHCVPVMVTKKMNVVFSLWLAADGSEAFVSGLGDNVTVGKTGVLQAGAKFNVDTEDALWTKVSANAYTEYLPNDVLVAQKGTKWELPKAGKLTMKKGVLDDSKKGENPSGLKLRPKKDGTFTGSFKVYFAEKDKLKSKTANVKGIVINGVGHGTATIKGVGSVRITIE